MSFVAALPDVLLSRILEGLLLDSGQPPFDDGALGPPPPLRKRSACSEALDLQPHCDLRRLRERMALASQLAVVDRRFRGLAAELGLCSIALAAAGAALS